MTPDAQNALRRIMEESHHNGVLFCLICNYNSHIIKPLKSRCFVAYFPRLQRDEMINRLRLIADQESLRINDEVRFWFYFLIFWPGVVAHIFFFVFLNFLHRR